jgi:hypothetical protein
MQMCDSLRFRVRLLAVRQMPDCPCHRCPSRRRGDYLKYVIDALLVLVTTEHCSTSLDNSQVRCGQPSWTPNRPSSTIDFHNHSIIAL